MRGLSIGLTVALWVPTLGLGCSSGGGGAPTLTCDWLAGDNCWKDTAAAAAACLPPTSETGALSADGRTCTYASGAVITFATPIVLPLPDNAKWNFTVTNGGQDCLHYEDSDAGIKLVVGGQTFAEHPTGGLGIAVSCPDGTSYSNSNALSLLSCGADGGFFGGLPGEGASWTDTSVNLSLLSTSTTSSEGLQIFDCSK